MATFGVNDLINIMNHFTGDFAIYGHYNIKYVEHNGVNHANNLK